VSWAMREKAADDASAGGQNSRQTEGDLVRVAKSVVLGMNSWQTRVLWSKKEVTR
jgi:hypothetical protein